MPRTSSNWTSLCSPSAVSKSNDSLRPSFVGLRYPGIVVASARTTTAFFRADVAGARFTRIWDYGIATGPQICYVALARPVKWLFFRGLAGGRWRLSDHRHLPRSAQGSPLLTPFSLEFRYNRPRISDLAAKWWCRKAMSATCEITWN